MMTDGLQGELFVEPDGVAFVRPASKLGYGIGRLSVTHSSIGVATFELKLEVYSYQNIAAVPPEKGVMYSGKGIVAVAHAAKKNYRTFTLHGTVRGDTSQEQPFNAAKLAPWDSASQPRPWEPDANVKTSMQQVFRTSPQILLNASRASRPAGITNMEQYRVGDINSVYYIPNYISEEEEAAMLGEIQSTPLALKSKLTKRLVQEWGCSMCSKCNQSFVYDGNLPPWSESVGDLLLHDRIFSPSTFPNNIRIHEYETGEGIAPHVDGPIYVPLVAIVSLASTSVMSFYPRQEPYDQPMEHYNDTFKFDGHIAKQRPHMSVVLEPRSLLVFRDEAYSHYPHGISDKAVDSLDEQVSGPVVNRHLLDKKDITEVARKYRVGVTVRNLLPRCDHAPERAEYAMRRAWSIYHKQPLVPSSVPRPAGPPPSVMQPESPSPTPLTHPTPVAALDVMQRLEAKLDAVLAQQAELKASVRELQEVVAVTTAASASFRTEMATILNYMSSTVLQIDSSVDEMAAKCKEKEDR